MSKLLHHFDTLVIYVSFSDRKSSAVSIQFHSGNFYLKLYVFPCTPFSEHLGLRKDITAVVSCCCVSLNLVFYTFVLR